MYIALFILVWLLAGAGSFTLAYKFESGKCPSRRHTFWAGVLGFVTVGASVIFFVAEAGEKMSKSDWWNKPVC